MFIRLDFLGFSVEIWLVFDSSFFSFCSALILCYSFDCVLCGKNDFFFYDATESDLYSNVYLYDSDCSLSEFECLD